MGVQVKATLRVDTIAPDIKRAYEDYAAFRSKLEVASRDVRLYYHAMIEQRQRLEALGVELNDGDGLDDLGE